MYIKINKKIKISPSEEMKEFVLNVNHKQLEIRDWIMKKGINERKAESIIIDFILYWTEKNKSGTKMRWELQPTFELKRRLITWINNDKSLSNSSRNIIQL